MPINTSSKLDVDNPISSGGPAAPYGSTYRLEVPRISTLERSGDVGGCSAYGRPGAHNGIARLYTGGQGPTEESIRSEESTVLATVSHTSPMPRIATDNVNDDVGGLYFRKADERFPTFGSAAEALRNENDSLRPDEVNFKSASAPEATDAFPVHLRESEIRDTMAMSPAQSFLSMFSPVVSSTVPPDAEGQDVGVYTLGPIVGHGGFSTIRKGYSSSGAVVAVKIVRRSDLERQVDAEEARRQLANEAAIWSSLNHEHVLPLFDYEHTSYADFFITLYCPAGSLFDILQRDGRPALPQDDAGTMFRQIVRGLRYLHEGARIVHRDIKLENVFVDDTGTCRIGDFGLARRLGDSTPALDCVCEQQEPEAEDGDRLYDRVRRHTTTEHSISGGPSYHSSLKRPGGPSRHRSSMPLGASEKAAMQPFHFQPGSLPYASPELLCPPSSGSCAVHSLETAANPAQDLWALGVLLYALLTGRLPFMDNFEPRLQMKILHGAYELPVGIGHGAERVLRGCLERSVDDRWTIDMVDDVAWGVGWGLAGDVSCEQSSSSPVEEIRNHGGHDYRKSRSRSRVKPYPDHTHHDSAAAAQHTNGHDGLAPTIASSSRSRSRSTRGASGDRSSERASMVSSLHSALSLSSFTSGENCLSSPPSLTPLSLAPRGRRMQKTLSGASAASASSNDKSSLSDSRSRSASPSTPADPDLLRIAPFDHAGEDGLEVRGRRRAVRGEGKAERGESSGSSSLPDVVEEV